MLQTLLTNLVPILVATTEVTLHDRVVIRRLTAEEKTRGGIIIPDTAQESRWKASVTGKKALLKSACDSVKSSACRHYLSGMCRRISRRERSGYSASRRPVRTRPNVRRRPSPTASRSTDTAGSQTG